MAYQKIKNSRDYNPNKVWELTDEQAEQLARELWYDPKQLGYAGKNSVQIEALLNDRPAYQAEETVLVETVDPAQIRDTIPYAEYADWQRRSVHATWWQRWTNKSDYEALRLLWHTWEQLLRDGHPLRAQSDHFRQLRDELKRRAVISRDTYQALEALTTQRRPVPLELKQFGGARTDVLFGTAEPWSSFIHVTAADIELVWQQKGKDRPSVIDILTSLQKDS